MAYITKMTLGGMIYIPKSTTIVSGIQIILSYLTKQLERLQCWY
jgi:hypothetical protein